MPLTFYLNSLSGAISAWHYVNFILWKGISREIHLLVGILKNSLSNNKKQFQLFEIYIYHDF